ncbi:MAG: hypothetical protein Q8L09_00115 [Candidatus Moranbacteria bacterium]|nr:hypothetical protein [Candidatus Moranbacteria bacterium]
MYCLVDFRNRPQYKHTFRALEKAKECLKKIRNNPLGATIIYADGRREYFENGLPEGYSDFSGRSACVKKGCHVKYKIRRLGVLDGLAKTAHTETKNIPNWKEKSIFSLFMLGNRKFYACLVVLALIAFSFSFLFQKKFGPGSIARSGDNGEIQGRVAGAMDSKVGDSSEDQGNDASLQLADADIIMSLLGKVEEKQHSAFQKEILGYIKGKPMESMSPYIAKQPRIVAAFIVGIAMKESKFGIYAPHDSSGRDCLNYWGYRGRENTTASGYSCFDSPEHAIQVVGKKIASLVNRGISNPAEMISWKCGSTCAGHGAENVRKWIADVGVNFYKINKGKNS